jgi:hypothetical protein
MVVALLILAAPAWAYYHHESKIRWHEYSGDAFNSAREQGRPIFIYVTASWCFWCRAFEEDVLERDDVAAYLNQHFISVFLDYDARPDLGGDYQQGGLPTVVLQAPDRELIINYPGYMEKDKFMRLLQAAVEYVEKEWSPGQRVEIEDEALTVKREVTPEGLRRYAADYESLLRVSYDPLFGGFSRYGGIVTWEEKYRFPQPHVLEYLLQTGVETEKAERTLDYMGGIRKDEVKIGGPDYQELLSLMREPVTQEWISRVEEINKRHPYAGIYDPVEGGFFRYSTRRNWYNPRFEKLLDDNARLVRVYLGYYNATGREEYLEVASKTLEYILRVLHDGEAGFYGSQEASELYYHLPGELREIAPKPGIDMRGYADRNAEMVATLFYAGRVMNDPGLSSRARALADWMLREMTSDKGALYYYDYRSGESSLDGLLRANVFLAMAGLRAYEYTGEERYLIAATRVLDYALRSLYDTELGGFYERNSTSMEYYPRDELFSPEKPLYLNALMTRTLLEAYGYTDRAEYLRAAEETLALITAAGLRNHELDHLAPAAESARLLAELLDREVQLAPTASLRGVEALRMVILGALAAGTVALISYKLWRREK